MEETKKTTNKTLWTVIFLILLGILFNLGSCNFQIGSQQESSSKKTFQIKSSKAIGVVNVHGIILSSQAESDKGSMPVKSIIETLKEYSENSAIEAIVMHINSPGGAVPPTQEIYDYILKLRSENEKKIYCSISDIAASGGYYIASACEKIFANRGSITGSIGVIMQSFNSEELIKWAKIKAVTLKAGSMKDAGSPYRAMKAEELQYFNDLLSEIHTQFKDDILKGRKEKLNKEELNSIADGRIFTGQTAQKLGLIDEIGSLDHVVEVLKKELDLPEDTEIVTKPKKKTKWAFLLENKFNLNKEFEGVLKKVSPFHSQLKKGIPYFFYEGAL